MLSSVKKVTKQRTNALLHPAHKTYQDSVSHSNSRALISDMRHHTLCSKKIKTFFLFYKPRGSSHGNMEGEVQCCSSCCRDRSHSNLQPGESVVDFIQKDYFQVKITQISQNDFLQSYHLFSPGDLKIFIFYRNISSLCTARVS